MYFNYGLIEDFMLTLITLGILNAIDLRLNQGKLYCVAKATKNTPRKNSNGEFQNLENPTAR